MHRGIRIHAIYEKDDEAIYSVTLMKATSLPLNFDDSHKQLEAVKVAKLIRAR